MVDGKAVVSCNLGLEKVAGKAVVTLEGVDADERQRFADAFAACGGLQCGFCIPGIVMRAKSQIDKKGADLDRAAMAPHLGAHLCRCTGYVKILDAIEAVAKGKSFQPALGAGDRRVAAPSTRPPSWRSATAATSTTSACRACCTPRCTSPTTPAPTSRRSTRRPRRPPTASSACSPRPTSPASCASGSSTRTGRS